MWKRMMTLAAIALFGIASIFALEEEPPYVALGLGGSVSLSIPLEENAATNLHPALEARARVMWFDFALVADYTRLSDGYNEYSTFLGIGLCNRDARKLRVGLEIGPRFRWILKDGDDSSKYYLDTDKNPVVQVDDLDCFANSPVAYRLTVDYLLASNVALGCFYQVDTDYRFERWERVVDLFSCDWETGRLGVSCLYFFDLGGKRK